MTKAIYSWAFLFILLLNAAFAQQLTLNPYSRYAIGEIFHPATARNTAMGGVGIASENYFSVNRLNPASFGDILFTTLDFSGFGQVSNLATNSASENQITAGFQQVAFAFPTNQNMAFTLGFSPFSAVGYQVESLSTITLSDSAFTLKEQFLGSGGTNQAFMGVAGRMLDDKLRLGLSIQYIFGGIRQEWISTITRTDTLTVTPYQPVTVESDRYLKGFNGQFGFIYQDTVVKSKRILYRIGGMVDYNLSLKEDLLTTYTNNFVEDTLDSRTTELRELDLPIKFGAGFSMHRPGYWSFAADFTYQDWNPFEVYTTGVELGQEMRLSLGGEWIPNLESEKYMRRMSYRFGGYYKQSYLSGFGDGPVNDYGLTFGFGLPSSRKGNSRLNPGRSVSSVNMSFAVGQRGSLTANHPLQERYARFTLGINLNDRWFIPRVVD